MAYIDSSQPLSSFPMISSCFKFVFIYSIAYSSETSLMVKLFIKFYPVSFQVIALIFYLSFSGFQVAFLIELIRLWAADFQVNNHVCWSIPRYIIFRWPTISQASPDFYSMIKSPYSYPGIVSHSQILTHYYCMISHRWVTFQDILF